MHQTRVDEVSQVIKDDLRDTELKVLTEGVTLASLIRAGSQYSEQAHGWTEEGNKLCALSAAAAALKALD